MGEGARGWRSSRSLFPPLRWRVTRHYLIREIFCLAEPRAKTRVECYWAEMKRDWRCDWLPDTGIDRVQRIRLRWHYFKAVGLDYVV